MSSGFRQALGTLLFTVAAGAALNYQLARTHPAPEPQAVERVPKTGELRVCADPNNLPFSNREGAGFENELAGMVARDLGLRVRYTWWPQRRGFIRSTLRAAACDVVMGVPASYELAQPTRPYYRSSYVFVTRGDRNLHIESFDDERLRTLRIGLHVIGDDYNNVPPAQELAARGIVENVRGYTIYGAYSQPDPPKNLIDAVAHDEIDVAIAWGPLAGYFARREAVPLNVTPIHETHPSPNLPMTFSIAMGVRQDDRDLKVALDALIERRQAQIDALLSGYGVPLLDDTGASLHASTRTGR